MTGGPAGTVILTAKLARQYNTGGRLVDSNTIGNLLREIAPETVERVSHGISRRTGVPA